MRESQNTGLLYLCSQSLHHQGQLLTYLLSCRLTVYINLRNFSSIIQFYFNTNAVLTLKNSIFVALCSYLGKTCVKIGLTYRFCFGIILLYVIGEAIRKLRELHFRFFTLTVGEKQDSVLVKLKLEPQFRSPVSNALSKMNSSDKTEAVLAVGYSSFIHG